MGVLERLGGAYSKTEDATLSLPMTGTEPQHQRGGLAGNEPGSTYQVWLGSRGEICISTEVHALLTHPCDSRAIKHLPAVLCLFIDCYDIHA